MVNARKEIIRECKSALSPIAGLTQTSLSTLGFCMGDLGCISWRGEQHPCQAFLGGFQWLLLITRGQSHEQECVTSRALYAESREHTPMSSEACASQNPIDVSLGKPF